MTTSTERQQQQWLHRDEQVHQLRMLLNRLHTPDVFAYGPAGTCKTSVVRSLLDGKPHAYINCCRGLKLRSLLGSALAQFKQGGKRKRGQAFAGESGLESSLIWELSAACPADQTCRVLVLDDVQQLLAATDSPLPALLALREQTGANMSLLLISRAQPGALGLLGLLPGLLPLAFPAYTDSQLVDILAAAGPLPLPATAAGSSSSNLQASPAQLQATYRRFLQAVLVPEFKRLSRCLPDIASQVAALWPRYAGAAGAQQQQSAGAGAAEQETEVDVQAAMFAAVQPKVQSALRSFQPAACCAIASLAAAGQGQQQGVAASQQQQQQQQQVVIGMSGAHMAAGLELSRMAKLLLVAAFLASRNKPSVDKQLFCQGEGWRRRGGRRKNAMGADRQAEAAKAAELKGPHTFSLSRLLAVYTNLLAAEEEHDSSALGGSSRQQQQEDERQQLLLPGGRVVPGGGWLGPQRAEVLTGLNSLVAARLMNQACDDLLEAPRFGCAAPVELVESLALDLGLPLTSYLKYV